MNVWFLLQQIAMQTATVYTMPIFWLVVLLLAIQVGMQQNQRQHVWKSWTLDHNNHNIWDTKQTAKTLSVFLSTCLTVLQVMLAILFCGWVGGMVAGVLLVGIGVYIPAQTLLWLWGLTILLMSIQKRFVCFAYAGAIATWLQLRLYHDYVTGQQILMLVAVLHFTEAVLVRSSGTLQQMPVYLRDKRGRTITGMRLQMTWPLPLVMAVPVSESTNGMGMQAGYLTMPDWWPLLAATPEQGSAAVLYQLLPMLAAIGYHDMTQDEGAHRARRASRLLLLYSVILGGLVICSRMIPLLLYVAALVSVIGHELIAKR